MRDFIKNILLISIPSVIILFILLEIVLSFFMPLPSRPQTIYDEQTDILKFSPESGSGTYTKGKFFQLRARWNINNDGWNSPVDFHTDHKKDLTVIIGDSYIEALQVDIEKSYPNLLRDMLQEAREVYAFGKSLYPLTQYLHVSRYIVEKYNPNTLIFNVVHNDFQESIAGARDDERFRSLLQVTIHPDSSVTEIKPDLTNFLDRKLNPGFVRTWVRKSRVQRYIRHPEYLGINFRNMISDFLDSINENDSEPQKFEGNINPEEVLQMEEKIERAVDYTVSKIRNENPDKRIIFVMDAPRQSIYSGIGVTKSSAYRLTELLRKAAAKHSVEFIDLAPLMESDYKENQKRFDSGIDSHWNEYGHQFVAKTLYNYLTSEN